MEKERFKLIPLYDLNAVLKTWHLYQDGLEMILNNSGEDTNLTKVFNDIMSGKLLLWIGFVDGVYAGFLTTSFQQIFEGPKYGWVVHTYKRISVPTDFLLEGLNQIEVFFKDQQCDYIKFYALKKPWQDKLVLLGYKPMYIEYLKSLKEEKKGEDIN